MLRLVAQPNRGRFKWAGKPIPSHTDHDTDPEKTVLTGPASIKSYQFRARSRLKGFKRFSLVAVTLVALFHLVMEPAPGTFSGNQLNAAVITGTETI